MRSDPLYGMHNLIYKRRAILHLMLDENGYIYVKKFELIKKIRIEVYE